MESRIYGVPLSAAQMGPSNNSFSGIRARLTVDDSDSNVGSDYSGSESEGFESGEDMLETAGVGEEDGDIVEETGPVKKSSISEDAVVGLNGEIPAGSSSNERGFVKESGSVSENAVIRPYAKIPKGSMFKRAGSFVDSDGSGSFMSGSSDDELAEDEEYVASSRNSRPVVALVGDVVSEEERTPVMSPVGPSARKLKIPVAKISGDSDDDTGGGEVLFDGGLSSILRVPSIKVLHRINSAPRVRMLEADEGYGNKSQAEDVVEMQLDGNLPASGMDFSPLDEKEPVVVESSLVQDNGSDFKGETMASLSSMNDVLNPTSESGQNVYLIHLDEKIKEVDMVDDFKECSELVDHREAAEVGERGSNNYSGAASMGNLDSSSSNTGLEDNHIFNQNNESEIVESIKQEIDHTVESFSSKAAYEISPAHQFVDVKEVPAEGVLGPELPEAVTESMPICSSDSIFEDASQSAFESSNLEKETGRGAETSDLLPGEVEHSRFCLDIETFGEEMDMDGGMSDRRHIIDPVVSVDGTDTSYVEINSDDLGIFDSACPGIVARSPSGVDPSLKNGEHNEALSKREKEKIKKIQRILVKYLLLLDRLGRSPEDHVASKVLYQLTLAAGSSSSQAFHLDSIKIASMELESHRKDDFRVQLSILVIGKTGVGKSATINSIFGERVAATDAFEPATTRVKETVGLINGVKLKVFDTPGLRTSLMDQSINRKILSSIKRLMKKSPPDVILYVDRMDTQRGEFNDLPLVRLVTSCLGSSIWRKSVVVFTHGTSLPPDGPNGYPLSYEAFVSQQSRIIQRLISHSAWEPVVGNSGSTVPVCVIENHPSLKKNGHGGTLLHHGESWRSQLLLLCFSMKILSELSSLVMNQSPLDYGRLFGLLICSPPLSYLSSFLQSSDKRGDAVGTHVEICHSSDSNQVDIEHQSLKETRRVSIDNMDGVSVQEPEASESEAVPLAETALLPSFVGDDSKFRTRPALFYRRWDLDYIYNDLLHEGAGLDVLILEEKLPYNLKGKTNIKNFRKNQTRDGVSITFVGEYLVEGLEFADRIANGKQIVLVGNAGIIQSQDDAAYAVDFDLRWRDKDHPINQDETSVGLSVMRYRDDLIHGCNLHSQISIRGNSKLDIAAALNSRPRGHISVKTSSCDQLPIAALVLIPMAGAVLKKLFH